MGGGQDKSRTIWNDDEKRKPLMKKTKPGIMSPWNIFNMIKREATAIMVARQAVRNKQWLHALNSLSESIGDGSK